MQKMKLISPQCPASEYVQSPIHKVEEQGKHMPCFAQALPRLPDTWGCRTSGVSHTFCLTISLNGFLLQVYFPLETMQTFGVWQKPFQEE